MISGFASTGTPLTAPLSSCQGERGVPGLPGEHGDKGEPGEGVIGSPVSMMFIDWPFSNIHYLVQTVIPSHSSLYLSLNTLSDENAGHYCEAVEYCTPPFSYYMLCTDSLNLTDLIASESAFIFEIQDCWRQRINRAKGV